MIFQHIVLDEACNVTLDVYLQDVGGEYGSITKRPAVLVIPGGGYAFCSDREAEPVAFQFLAAGYDAFILRYSVGKYAAWPKPLQDYEKAFAYIEDHSEEWHVFKDKIAVCGFSAGGHLAGAAATIAEHKPAAALLGYAVLAESVRDYQTADAPYIYQQVTEKTAPCFLFASQSDTVVPVLNTLKMAEALTVHNITYECHIYPYGPHGFSTGLDSIQAKSAPFCGRICDWVKDSIGFLEDLFGRFCSDQDTGLEQSGLNTPVCDAHTTADGEAWLSVDCTIGRIFNNPDAVEAISWQIKTMRSSVRPFTPEMTFDDMMHILRNMRLRDMLLEYKVPVDMEEINGILKKIPNTLPEDR